MQETQVRSLGQEDALEKEMATHSTILAWKIPWTEEPGGPQSMGWKELDMTATEQQPQRIIGVRENMDKQNLYILAHFSLFYY